MKARVESRYQPSIERETLGLVGEDVGSTSAAEQTTSTQVDSGTETTKSVPTRHNMQALVKDNEQSSQSKRSSYAARACLECKRRKIKCDGQRPCRRCAVQEAPCIYQQANRRGRKESARPKWLSKTSGPTFDKFDGLYNQVIPISGVGDDTVSTSAPIEQKSLTESPTQSYPVDEATPYRAPDNLSPSFYGPSSSEFTLNVVNGNLKAMGLNSVLNDVPTPEDTTLRQFSFEPSQYGPFMKMLTMDPLWDIKRADALRLTCDFCRGPGSTYPIFDYHTMIDIANRVFGSLESAQGGRLKDRGLAAAEAIFNAHTNKLKVVIAIGRTLEKGGRSDQAQRLFQSVTDAVEGLLWNSDGICGVQLLVLVALYYYHLDDQVRTFRIIGFAARHCLEMGLHRRETILKTFRTDEERMIALRVFWSVYTLERRTSLSQGVPYSIQDSHIDSSLFTMEIANPFLSNMVEWTQLAGKAWQILNNQSEKSSTISKDEIDFLDYQILRWYNQIPDDLQLSHARASGQVTEESAHQDPLYLPTTLYIRKNYIRNLIYRPILQSGARIRDNERYAHIAADIAKTSIATLWQLNQSSNLIGTHPIVFKHFVLSSFGNLSLLVVNATNQFWPIVRDEFHLALKLIRLLSTRSGPLMRLWKRLQGLEELQAKITTTATANAMADLANSQRPSVASKESQPTEEFRVDFPDFCEAPTSSDSMMSTVEGSYIRDEFAGLFDQAVDSDSFFDFPFTEFGK